MNFGENYSKDNLGQRKTYLSSNVMKLVCYQPEVEMLVSETADKLFLEDGILDWTRIENEYNLKECFLSTGGCDYHLAISCLYPVSLIIHDYLCEFTTEEFEKQYKVQLEWTTKSDILLHCFELIKSTAAGSVEASILLLSSTLERILGDIFLAYSDATSCPMLLRDLLEMNELKSVLGETVMFCLDVYIGPPAGLNLRNLAWHGFLSPGEAPPQHVSFLLMLTISLRESVKTNSKGKKMTKLKERPLITYSKPTLLREVIREVEINNFANLFRESNFVTTSMIEIWNLAVDFYEKERFADVVIMLLPQLEHSFRRIYACCNNFPERLQTAESSELYTTFHEILSPVLPNRTSNNLLKVIGPRYMEMLLDILLHQEGPRLRDHISHGEVNLCDFPKDFANHILFISVAFCQKFWSNKEFAPGVSRFPEISQAVQSYSSIFHPLSCLRREHLSYINGLLQWKNLPRPSHEEFLYHSCENLCGGTFSEIIIGLILKNYDSQSPKLFQGMTEERDFPCNEAVLQKALKILKNSTLCTLFRQRRELEIVALLRNIVNKCSLTSGQIQQTAKSRYEEWKNKQLRSRQRNNYKRFWFHAPLIGHAMTLFVVIVVVQSTDVENIDGDEESRAKFLKRCLQCAENLASLSSPSKNRWHECAEIAKLLLKETRIYYRS